MRERILSEIKRIAKSNGGIAPGIVTFENETGIRPQDWRGKIWARWGDAVREAGLVAQELNQKWKPEQIFPKLAEAFRYYGRIPTKAELQIYKQNSNDFPWHSSLENHFGSKANMLAALRQWASTTEGFDDIKTMIPDSPMTQVTTNWKTDGYVYLIKSGPHYKIGRGDELEKRVKQIRTALPDASTLEHSIRTDDPSGIEAYWHRRFADKRANGEWFKLTMQDVAAFKKRRYQ